MPQRKVNKTAVVSRPAPYNPPPPPPPQGPSWRGVVTAAALAVCVGGGVTYLAKVWQKSVAGRDVNADYRTTLHPTYGPQSSRYTA